MLLASVVRRARVDSGQPATITRFLSPSLSNHHSFVMSNALRFSRLVYNASYVQRVRGRSITCEVRWEWWLGRVRGHGQYVQLLFILRVQ